MGLEQWDEVRKQIDSLVKNYGGLGEDVVINALVKAYIKYDDYSHSYHYLTQRIAESYIIESRRVKSHDNS